MSVARRTLAHDGFHLPYAFLFNQNLQPITVIGMHFEDQAEKYMAFRRLARQVDRLGADVVVLINEMWVAQMPEGGLGPAIEPSEQTPRSLRGTRRHCRDLGWPEPQLLLPVHAERQR